MQKSGTSTSFSMQLQKSNLWASSSQMSQIGVILYLPRFGCSYIHCAIKHYYSLLLLHKVSKSIFRRTSTWAGHRISVPDLIQPTQRKRGNKRVSREIFSGRAQNHSCSSSLPYYRKHTPLGTRFTCRFGTISAPAGSPPFRFPRVKLLAPPALFSDSSRNSSSSSPAPAFTGSAAHIFLSSGQIGAPAPALFSSASTSGVGGEGRRSFHRRFSLQKDSVSPPHDR